MAKLKWGGWGKSKATATERGFKELASNIKAKVEVSVAAPKANERRSLGRRPRSRYTPDGSCSAPGKEGFSSLSAFRTRAAGAATEWEIRIAEVRSAGDPERNWIEWTTPEVDAKG